ncbi:hypothetical protein ANCDUO_15867 [Ancylostoma duodenale]|uniref:Uncharacterized protein n=1 Tax=Ancylostoma duodenale TaxID=51022 RepID=A0A0C2G513_9BILA|nr:hypothetical protein ANCDUO_15867 [Ancylostoma duodenale]
METSCYLYAYPKWKICNEYTALFVDFGLPPGILEPWLDSVGHSCELITFHTLFSLCFWVFSAVFGVFMIIGRTS